MGGKEKPLFLGKDGAPSEIEDSGADSKQVLRLVVPKDNGKADGAIIRTSISSKFGRLTATPRGNSLDWQQSLPK